MELGSNNQDYQLFEDVMEALIEVTEMAPQIMKKSLNDIVAFFVQCLEKKSFSGITLLININGCRYDSDVND